MTCDQARDAVLTADLAELDGSRPGPLATHLETCPACRAAADRIATTTRALQAERAIPPSRHPAHAAAAARAQADRIRRARRLRWGLVPLIAAAAGLAAILILRDGAQPGQPLPPRAVASPPLVESAPGHVAVLTTDNPAIVVVWQF